jgi:murein tripeptide amidase MpaA
MVTQTQEFKRLELARNFKHQDLEAHGMLDGCTLIVGVERALERQERLAIVAHFDEVWKKANAEPDTPQQAAQA